MKKLITTIGVIALVGIGFFCVIISKGDTPSAESTIYDSDTNHRWNRLNETLFARTAPDGKKFGLDELDILYWYWTKHLLVEPSHHEALAILDDFINSHGEKLIQTPLKRALLQRDLWQLFDWSAKNSWNSDEAHARRELQSRLVVAIRRLALTTNEIKSLPDNYAQSKDVPDLPHGLFQTNGDWVIVHDNNDELTAPVHVSEFDGHSVFSVLLHVPGGRQSAIAYLDKLRSFAKYERMWVYRTNDSSSAFQNSPRELLQLSPNIPQFPTNTEWAIVRQMCVIDTEGRIQPTAVIESIQLRHYSEIKGMTISPQAQKLSEFVFDRRQSGVLRAIGQEEKGFVFVHFRGKGRDAFEVFDRFGQSSPPPNDSTKVQSVVLKTCIECHSSRGIYSVNSFTRSLLPQASQRTADLSPSDVNSEVSPTISWKHRQFDWGLLQGLWRQAD